MKQASFVKLSIRNAEFYAMHGVKEEERKLGGKYQVDADLYYDGTKAIVNDDVSYALNYEEAMYIINEVIESESYNLVETIANEILNMLMEKFSMMEKATVRVRKLNVPMRFILDCIEVEQSVERRSE